MCQRCEGISTRDKTDSFKPIYYANNIESYMLKPNSLLNNRVLSNEYDHIIYYCPWCGKKLETIDK